MRKYGIFFIMLLVPVFFSCKDDIETPVDQYELLSDYLVEQSMDLPDLLSGWIVGAPDEAGLTSFLNDNYVIDIRAEDAFNSGHIEGAVHSSLGTILDDAVNATKPIVVACYTGQSAGHAVMALRLMGYTDARVLKFGMSGWNSNFSGPWVSNSGSNGNVGVGHNMWKNGSPASSTNFANQNFESSFDDPQFILEDRVNYMIQQGFKGISGTDVLSSPSAYFINNFWAEADANKYGIIDGAYRIFPLSLESGDFDKLDSDKTVVTYCWTGQTSSMVTAYLTVLGFEAKSLKFGANGMIYDQLESHKFSTPTIDLPVVTTE